MDQALRAEHCCPATDRRAGFVDRFMRRPRLVAVLPLLPRGDSDDAGAPTDRERARARGAYAPRVTGPAEWRFCWSSKGAARPVSAAAPGQARQTHVVF